MTDHDDLGASAMLHVPSIERIKSILKKDTEGNDMIAVMTSLAAEAELEDDDVGQCAVTFMDESDEFKEGTWVPELWIVVRKVLPDES